MRAPEHWRCSSWGKKGNKTILRNDSEGWFLMKNEELRVLSSVDRRNNPGYISKRDIYLGLFFCYSFFSR